MNYIGFSVHKLIILGVKNGGGEFLPFLFLVDKGNFIKSHKIRDSYKIQTQN